MKSSIFRILLTIGAVFLTSVLYINASNGTYLDSLVGRAISLSPKIKMLKEQQKSAENRIPQNSNLPDPMVTVGIMNLPDNTFSFSQEPMTGKTIAISQSFPYPGKLGSIAKWQSVDTAIVTEEILETENEIRRSFLNEYFSLTYIRQSQKITESIKEMLKSIAEVVQAKYAVATARQQNMFKIEMEITNINEMLVELDGKEKEQLSRLNALLFRPADETIITDSLPEPGSLKLSTPELIKLSEKNKPALAMIKLNGQKYGYMAESANYDFNPNFNVMVQYSNRNTLAPMNKYQSDLLSASVGISIPLNYGGKVTGKVQEAKAMEESTQYQYSTTIQTLEGEFGASISKLNTIESRLKLLKEGLLPQSQENLNSSLSDYQVDRVDFLNVIDAEKMLYDIQLKIYRLKMEYFKELASLEFLTGSKIIN